MPALELPDRMMLCAVNYGKAGHFWVWKSRNGRVLLRSRMLKAGLPLGPHFRALMSDLVTGKARAEVFAFNVQIRYPGNRSVQAATRLYRDSYKTAKAHERLMRLAKNIHEENKGNVG